LSLEKLLNFTLELGYPGVFGGRGRSPRVYLGFKGLDGEFGFRLQEFELSAQIVSLAPKPVHSTKKFLDCLNIRRAIYVAIG
jgi:hypothetical protein